MWIVSRKLNLRNLWASSRCDLDTEIYIRGLVIPQKWTLRYTSWLLLSLEILTLYILLLLEPSFFNLLEGTWKEWCSLHGTCQSRVFQICGSNHCQGWHFGYDGPVWFDCEIYIKHLWYHVLCTRPAQDPTHRNLQTTPYPSWSMSTISSFPRWVCSERSLRTPCFQFYFLVL